MKLYTPKDKLLGLFCLEFGDLYDAPYYFSLHFLIRQKYWFDFGYDIIYYDCLNYHLIQFGPLFCICWVTSE